MSRSDKCGWLTVNGGCDRDAPCPIHDSVSESPQPPEPKWLPNAPEPPYQFSCGCKYGDGVNLVLCDLHFGACKAYADSLRGSGVSEPISPQPDEPWQCANCAAWNDQTPNVCHRCAVVRAGWEGWEPPSEGDPSLMDELRAWQAAGAELFLQLERALPDNTVYSATRVSGVRGEPVPQPPEPVFEYRNTSHGWLVVVGERRWFLPDEGGPPYDEAPPEPGENERLREAIRWALGESGEFRQRGTGEGAYWWRKELRARAEGSGSPVPSRAEPLFSDRPIATAPFNGLTPRQYEQSKQSGGLGGSQPGEKP